MCEASVTKYSIYVSINKAEALLIQWSAYDTFWWLSLFWIEAMVIAEFIFYIAGAAEWEWHKTVGEGTF